MERRYTVITRHDMHRPVREFVAPVKVVLSVDQTIEEALHAIRKGHEGEKILYFYVLNKEGQLRGVISTRALLLCPLDALVGDAMDEAFAFLGADHSLKDAMHALERHRLLALPVVDENFYFLGIIDVEIYLDDTIRKIDGLMRKDIFQFIGLKIEEGRLNTASKGYTARMPWLLCNVASGLICALIAKIFQVVLAKHLVLAMFIPLILTLCESVSMQAMTQSLVILRAPKVLWGLIRRRIWLEVKTVFFLSLTCSIGVGILSSLWGEGWQPVYMIGSALLIAIIVSALVGMIMPILLRICRLDPKLAAGPVILMIVDVTATAIYFGLASLFAW